jgi:hypothetical protein
MKMMNDLESSLLAGSLPEEALQLLAELHDDDLKRRLNTLGLATDRQDLLYELIRGKKKVGFYTKVDIQRFAFKALFPEAYKQLVLGHHLYSSSDLYEYDPPKNGQNMIKHGFSFAEVASHSSNFGTYIVACPDARDGTRYVMFSTIDAGLGDTRLDFPMPAVKGKVAVMSVAAIVDCKFRFISARFLSFNSRKKILKGAFKNLCMDDPVSKAVFMESCMRKIEELFFSLPSSTQVKP